MVTVSCSGKFHAFALAEQLERHHHLDGLFTSYASTKNPLLKRIAGRLDKEQIPVHKIHTNTLLAFPIKLWQSKVFIWNNLFDQWVASKLKNKGESSIFIGWSGMSLHSIQKAHQLGNITILERGSSHIVQQNRVLKEEYKKYGIDFEVHPAVIEKELKEYEATDYISVPSNFVERSFIAEGIKSEKIIINPYGVSGFFKPNEAIITQAERKFRILYVGSLSIRKGLIYLFEALKLLSIAEDEFEVWFIGKQDVEIDTIAQQNKRDNWRFFGHINHYELPELLVQCDIAVHPSVEEGLSMVIPQLMSCGIPVIATTNTGGENIITDGMNGYIIPIRSPAAIKEKIEYLFNHPKELDSMKEQATAAIEKGFTWNDYGDRYIQFIKKLPEQKA